MSLLMMTLLGLGAVVLMVALYDVTQKRHAILRNFPIVGHFRYLLESVGPELRQYIVTSNDEELPFSRDQRRWVYASSKKQNSYFGFGTDNPMEHDYLIIKHTTFSDLKVSIEDFAEDGYPLPSAKVLGASQGRAKAFRPRSLVNLSGMSYGSLSAQAIEAINRGVKIAGCLHNSGEGGVSPYHLHGGDLIWQIGTGYFGARHEDGRFNLSMLKEKVEQFPVKAIEIKLSQGAKPGLGGFLPKEKITAEVASIRGIPQGQDCRSPARHQAFRCVDSMLDFVEKIAAETGLPVGIKAAVGESKVWQELADAMADGKRGVDFITIDGGEGGTGAVPLVFSDHVALPFRQGFARVYREFAKRNLQHRLTFIGSGKLGLPETALAALAMGCDMVNVAREAMLAIGCIQAQRCHTGHCPAGIATQNRWLVRGLDPTSKADRLANYVTNLRYELLRLSHGMGVTHPALIGPERLELLDQNRGEKSLAEAFSYDPQWEQVDSQSMAKLFAEEPRFAS